MRKKIIAGNWKMNNDISATKNLINELKTKLQNENLQTGIIICPPFTSLETASTLVYGTKILLGAQNMHFEDSGAFTGEISANMLKNAGCTFVILGHSERRTIFNESDELINKKMKKALSATLKPIFCVGETLQQREEGITETIIKTQIVEGLKDIKENELENIIIAYEPVWAIGTGRNATPQQAQEVHLFIRTLISKLYSDSAAQNMVIQYGGSVKPDNAKELLSQQDVDGALVGGACLKADSFISIIKSA
ncbi:MAG: triose-phosphate isomerase [Ignavibacteriales bacterium]|nr:triose-phosphate isomerase [Ignavibacteriales bacterium]